MKKEESTAVVPVQEPGPVAVPDFLKEYGAEGLDIVGKYKNVSRLRITQALSNEDTKDILGEGTAYLSPDLQPVASYGEPFQVAPLFFWPSWSKWRDANDKSEVNPVVEESQDPMSEVARKAKNQSERMEIYPDNPRFRYSYREALNFAVEILSGPAKGGRVVMSFMVGSHKVGRRLCGYLERRGVPIWANVLDFQVGKTTNAKQQTYYVLDFAPAKNPFCSETEAKRLQAEHQGFKQSFDSGFLTVAPDVTE